MFESLDKNRWIMKRDECGGVKEVLSTDTNVIKCDERWVAFSNKHNIPGYVIETDTELIKFDLWLQGYHKYLFTQRN